MGFGKEACAKVFGKTGGKIGTYMGSAFEECAVQFLWQEMVYVIFQVGF